MWVGKARWTGVAPNRTCSAVSTPNSLSVPLPDMGSELPLPFGILRGWRGDLRVDVGSVLAGSRPILQDASADFAVADNRLRIERLSAKLGTGAVSGEFAFDAAASPPFLSLQVALSGATIDGPLAGASIDLLSGRADGTLQLAASGYSLAAILATLDGRAVLTVADGALSGFDLFRTKLAVENPDAKAAEAAASDALSSGATGFDRFGSHRYPVARRSVAGWRAVGRDRRRSAVHRWHESRGAGA